MRKASPGMRVESGATTDLKRGLWWLFFWAAHGQGERTMLDKLRDVNGAAEFLHLRPATIRKLVLERRISFIRVAGRSIRFRESELAKMLKAGEVPALRPLTGR